MLGGPDLRARRTRRARNPFSSRALARYHAGMDDFERKWKIIQEHLFAEATGAEPRPFSSGRTLFGIKSEAEQKMERFAREIEEEQLDALRKDAQESVGEFGTEGPKAPPDKKKLESDSDAL